MLERLGFEYRGFVDPFDGGPHLDAKTDDITHVKQTKKLTVADPVPMSRCKDQCMVSKLDPDGEFRAIDENVCLLDNKKIAMPKAYMEILQVSPGDKVGVTPMDVRPDRTTSKKAPAKKAAKTQQSLRRGAPDAQSPNTAQYEPM